MCKKFKIDSRFKLVELKKKLFKDKKKSFEFGVFNALSLRKDAKEKKKCRPAGAIFFFLAL